MKTAPRKLFLLAPLLLLTVAVVSACGGDDDDDDTTVGQLSDPNNVPTATAWLQPPEVLILDPNNLPTLPPNQPDTGGEDGEDATPEPGEPGVCGDTYTVEPGDITVNIAEECGVTVEAIEAANPDIDIRALTIGDVLIIPEPEEETAPEEEVPAEEEPAPEETAD